MTPIAKWDIFHYVYALLHHPAYREKYAANLRRELPRIPLAPDFWGFARAGGTPGRTPRPLRAAAGISPEVGWRKQGQPLNWRVDKMKLTPDKTAPHLQQLPHPHRHPPEVFAYKLGNRSALEWSRPVQSLHRHAQRHHQRPQPADDPQYITRLLGQVITVSLETLNTLKTLPDLE